MTHGTGTITIGTAQDIDEEADVDFATLWLSEHATPGSYSPISTADQFVIESDTDSGMTVVVPNTAVANMRLGRAGWERTQMASAL